VMVVPKMGLQGTDQPPILVRLQAYAWLGGTPKRMETASLLIGFLPMMPNAVAQSVAQPLVYLL